MTCCPFYGYDSFVAGSLFNFISIGLWGFCVLFLLSYAILTDLSSFAIVFRRKGELGALPMSKID